VAASKRDALAEHDPLPALEATARDLSLDVIPISSVTGFGLPELKRRLLARVKDAQPALAVLP
jgi:50S ribosomal subunit-associated GTPase HflX